MSSAPSTNGHRVAIIGGGFGGLDVARKLGRDPRIDLTLVDRRNHHRFQPLLYQVATGALAPGEIAQPLRGILRRNANTSVILGAVLTRWAWTFITHGRGSRLITGQPLLPDIEEPEPPA